MVLCGNIVLTVMNDDGEKDVRTGAIDADVEIVAVHLSSVQHVDRMRNERQVAE